MTKRDNRNNQLEPGRKEKTNDKGVDMNHDSHLGKRELIWHYTAEHCIADIVRCGYVDVARLFVVPPEKAVAWFSADQYWERTVRKLAPPYGSMQDMLRKGIKLYRIGVLPEAAPLNWTDIRKQSGMSRKTVRRLVDNAKRWGSSPWDWYGSFSPVLESKWQAVETFKNGWEKITATEIQKSELDDGQTQMSSRRHEANCR